MDLNNFNFDNSIQGFSGFSTDVSADIDPIKLKQLGFTDTQISILEQEYAMNGNVTTNRLVRNGLNYNEAKAIKYMYDICTGKIQVESEQDLQKHLKKMFGNYGGNVLYKLPPSTIHIIKRKCVIGGLPENSIFKIYNSLNFDEKHRMWDIENITAGKIYIKTPIKPQLKYKQSRKLWRIIDKQEQKYKFTDNEKEVNRYRDDDKYSIELSASIEELLGDGKVLVKIDKEYIRLCNKYIICVSTKLPESQLGYIKMMSITGDIIYVYATLGKMNEKISASASTRVYDYGYNEAELQQKLIATATNVYKTINAVYSSVGEANSEFRRLSSADVSYDSAADTSEFKGAEIGDTKAEDSIKKTDADSDSTDDPFDWL